jgi:phosphoribosyl 1,2-cyclic phosphodiesterase
MITIKTIASGSSGNCYRISDGLSVLMIECGIQYQAIEKAFNFDFSNVAGCLISHEHVDHAMHAFEIMLLGCVNCYMSAGTADALGLSGDKLKIVEKLKTYQVGTFTIIPFDIQHDAAEPMGFLIESKDGEKLLFATDTYDLKYHFEGINYYMIECNYYDLFLPATTRNDTNSTMKQNRIKNNHFGLERVKKFLRSQDLNPCREIHFIHISKSNIDMRIIKSEIQTITRKPIFFEGI